MHQLRDDMYSQGVRYQLRTRSLVSCCCFFAAIVSSAALAAVHRVPLEFATIQAALDGASNGDTVLVSVGTYEESLFPPSDLRFVLKGDVIPDTGDYPRPVIDPSNLENSDRLPCLYLDASHVATVEDFVFRNGPAMFPRRNLLDVGGIHNESSLLTIRGCVFDSTHKGLYPNRHALDVKACTFLNNPGMAIDFDPFREIPWPRTVVQDSRFVSRYGMDLARFPDSCQIIHCDFSGAEVHMSGSYVAFINNRFSALDPIYAAIFGGEIRFALFRGNTFSGISARGAPLMFSTTPHADTTRVEQNHFVRCRGVAALAASGGLVSLGQAVRVNGNVFDSCEANSATYGARAAKVGGGQVFTENRLSGHSDTIQCIAISQFNSAIPVLNRNLFLRTGLAIDRVGRDTTIIDAESNWWGDASGPYHATLNRDGHGDTIRGEFVDFMPWLTDTLLDVDDRRSVPLASTHISAFPNPFNGGVTIEFVTTKDEHMALEIFDLAGRLVATVADEQFSVGIHRRIWNAEQNASGIYFARLSAAGSGERAWLTKLVLLK